ncbi:MAG: hypothetical protein C5B43_02450 [Verrucomicrobia bacterium]|nr:MAG: hypothetical protein C5B43_02450 [Verrucomicrobiota bacterium]
MIKLKRLFLKSMVLLSLLYLVGLWGIEGDFEYCKKTLYNEHGQLTAVYESIYIPPITEVRDGVTIALSPEYFAERFSKIDKIEGNNHLKDVLNNAGGGTSWKHMIDEDELDEKMASMPEMMANSFDNLQDFMGGIGGMQDFWYCVDEIQSEIGKYGTKIDSLEKSFKKSRKKVHEADKKGDIVKGIQARQKAIQKARLLANSQSEFKYVIRDWNESGCGRRVGIYPDNAKWGYKTLKRKAKNYRKYKDTKKKELKDLEKTLRNKIEDYKRTYEDFERQRNEFNSRINELKEKSEKEEISDDELLRLEEQANRLKGFLNRLIGLAQELHFESEKREFRNRENEVRRAREKVQELRRREKESADKIRKARIEAEKEEEEYDEFDLLDEIDGIKLGQDFENLEKMFNGEMAPDIDVFHEVLSVFENPGIYGEEGQIVKELDVKMAGEYTLNSYDYFDFKYDVAMNLGRMVKGKSEVRFAEFGIYEVRGIKVEPENGRICLAFDGGNEKLLIESDFDSISNFIAQRKLEELMTLNPNFLKGSRIEPENLKIWGLDKETIKVIREWSSLIADFLPYLGTAKGFSELIYGYDYIGGDDVHRFIALCGVTASFVPIPGAAKAGKVLGEIIIELIRKGVEVGDKIPSGYYKTLWEATKKAGKKLSGRKMERLERHIDEIGEMPSAEERAKIWKLKPFDRGNEIENILAKTDYHDWFRVGQEMNGKFPLVDFQKGNVYVSLKTVDTKSKGWFSRMKKHIEALEKSGLMVSHKPAQVRLDIRVQPGGIDMKKAKKLEKFGENNRIEVRISEF